MYNSNLPKTIRDCKIDQPLCETRLNDISFGTADITVYITYVLGHDAT